MSDQGKEYASFRILLDERSENPALGFAEYAGALTELITQSKPQFSIGIFGSWGSGKTSLMGAIKNRLEPVGKPNPQIVTVWFNPWRYEKEEHLIVPLLDTLREALVDWSAQQSQDAKDRAVKAAATVARAARAILMGLRLKASF
jgi:predicted KAP-like P-loop ATPase